MGNRRGPEAGRTWWDRPLSPAIFWTCLCVMLLGYVIAQIVVYIYDADVYFLTATGREMIEKGGFLYENPWAIDPGQKLVVQQWLYCILVYFAEQGGAAGLTAFVLLQNVAMAILVHRMFRMDKLPAGYFVLSIFVAFVLSTRYQFSDRPECVTVLLLMLECYGLERAGREGRSRWLALLPISTLAEINVHGALWFVHYCVLAAYLVPDFFFKKTDGAVRDGLWKQKAQVLGWTLVSVGALFVNPYGIDGIAYVFNAFRARTFSIISILEQEPAALLGSTFVSVIVLAICNILCLTLWKDRAILRSQTLYLSLGFSLMALQAVKNGMFPIIALILVFRDLCRGVELRPELKDDLFQKSTNRTVPALLLCAALFVLYPISRVQARFYPTVNISMSHELERISEYIEDRGGKDSRVFTGFNTGCYFEYWGYHQIYIDARPELYTKVFNGIRDILAEYTQYCMDGCMLGTGDVRERAESMDAWFDGYDFDYVVVHPGSERLLAGYMLNKAGYRRVDDFRFYSVLLYEKAGEDV